MTDLRITQRKWLVSGLMLLMAVAVSLFIADSSLAHGYRPTATPTPTPTERPPLELQPCQVDEVIFDQPSYLTGDTIGVTLRVVDDQGAPLVGANVWVEVNRQPLSVQQSTEIDSIDLEDRSGYYDGFYNLTDLPGDYEFTFTVNDPTGERFLPCTDQGTVKVEIPTPTPTHTPTVTPTPTPTHTPTPEPVETMVQVVPETLTTTLCSLRDTTVVNVDQAVNLASVELEIAYNPDVIQVIDADRGQRGVQVRSDPVFNTAAISQNSVDTGNGRIYFAADLLSGQTIEGNQNLIAIDWRPQSVGTTAVTLERVVLRDTAGQSLEFESENGAVVVDFVTSCAFGSVALQQRTDHSGVRVTNGAGQQTSTLPDGSFGIPAAGPIEFTYGGYLSAQADLPLEMTPEQAQEGQLTTIQVGTVTLLAGDINGDNLVNILDLAYVAGNYLTADPAADLNADGTVNVFDLVLVAGNYQLRGPLAVE